MEGAWALMQSWESWYCIYIYIRLVHRKNPFQFYCNAGGQLSYILWIFTLSSLALVHEAFAFCVWDEEWPKDQGQHETSRVRNASSPVIVILSFNETWNIAMFWARPLPAVVSETVECSIAVRLCLSKSQKSSHDCANPKILASLLYTIPISTPFLCPRYPILSGPRVWSRAHPQSYLNDSFC